MTQIPVHQNDVLLVVQQGSRASDNVVRLIHLCEGHLCCSQLSVVKIFDRDDYWLNELFGTKFFSVAGT
jgi:hypothetical protein